MEELYRFIKRLNTNEKKYFRRFGLKDESKGDSQTRELFELLDSFENFEEEKIQNRLKRLKLDKQINHTKNYLFNLLTETITWYNREHFPGLSSAYELAKIQLLEEKGLFKEAEKLSSKAIDESFQKGSFSNKWDLAGYQIQAALNNFLSNKKNEPTETLEFLNDRTKLLEQMDRYHRYDNLLKQQQIIIRKAMEARSSDDLKVLNEIMENALVQNFDLATTPEAQFIFYTLRIQHFNIIGEKEKLLTEAEQLLSLIKSDAGQKISVMNRLWTYSQMAQALYFTNQWAKLETCLAELKNIKTQSTTESIAQFSYYTQLIVPLLDYKKDTKALIDALNEIKETLQNTGDELRPDVRMVITITCISGFVEYKEYGKAIDVCEHFLTNYNTGVRLDIMLLIYAYQFISQMELGNMLYVNNVIQNVNRYFLRNSYKGKFETTILHVFKKLSEIQNYSQHRKEILKLKKELNESFANASNTQHFGVLPVINTFLDSKVSAAKQA